MADSMPFDLAEISANNELTKEIRKYMRQHGGKLPKPDGSDAPQSFHDAVDAFSANIDKPIGDEGYAYYGYPHDSVAPRPGCSDVCDHCSEQFRAGLMLVMFPYKKCLTDDEAREELKMLRASTEANLSYVRARLKDYGDAIMKRWLKRGSKKRESLLVKAMPDVYRHKTSFVHEMIKGLKSPEDLKRCSRKVHLLPYLNIESLSENPNELLALLHYRTQSSAAQWAAFDSHQLFYYFHSGMCEVSYNPHCVTMYGDSYGQLAIWDQNAAHRWDIVGFPRGFLTLEAQDLLSRHLRSTIDLLMEPLPEVSSLGNTSFLASAEMKFNSKDGFINQDATKTTAFSLPPDLNMAEILDSLGARLRACEDELWLLQTDADYLREYISKLGGSVALEFTSEKEEAKVRIELIMLNMRKLDDWQYLVAEAEHARKTMTMRPFHIAPGGPLAKDYGDALAIFERVLKQQFKEQRIHLGNVVASSNAFRGYADHYDQERETVVLKAPSEKMYRHDPISYNIMELMRYNASESLPAAVHIRHIDNLLADCPPREAYKVDRTMRAILSDMALIDDTLTKIKLHRPRPVSTSNLLTDNLASPPGSMTTMLAEFLTRKSSLEFGQRVATHSTLMSMHSKDRYKSLHNALQILTCLRRSSSRKDAQKLEAFDRSQAALKSFWSVVRRWREDQLLKQQCSMEDVQRHMNAAFPYTLDQYEQELAAERAKVAAAIEENSKRPDTTRRTSGPQHKHHHQVQTVWGPIEQAATTPELAKEKKKTRPLEKDLAALHVVEPVSELSSSPSPSPLIAVSKTALNVFERMFAGNLLAKGNIRWNDFEAALIGAGFSVMPNSGSAVMFKEKSDRGSVVFHRPHPDPTIDPIMLRSMGKRLRKWFGFDRETFVEREKAAS
ncbi:hypothetical protein HII31_08892 [Pseudocercospora fuligena]|uniref:Uncharacterized protein n=1 Tax=Pseudocercospora fuligena TaxID=685502 RepID=A0A8H6VK79_9PEZI|nr:hypothetical protein HII31_08892 [Pseudocercospora fuligena]